MENRGASITTPSIEDLAKAIKPVNRFFAKPKGKRGKKPIRLALEHGYDLGVISDYDTEVTADETWLIVGPGKDLPRLTPKLSARVKVSSVGATRLAIQIYLKAPKQMRVIGPTQCVLEPRAWEGKSVKIVTQNGVEVRTIRQNGARWIEIDRPLDDNQPDMVAAFNEKVK